MKSGSLTLILALLVMVPSMAFGLNSHTPPPAFTPTPAAEYISGQTEVLLIQDVLPWDNNANEEELINFEKTYDKVHSDNLPANLSKYKVIMYASDQPTSYYQNIASEIGRISEFVNEGGLLLAHCCDQAWNGGDWTGLHILPGNVTHAAGNFLDSLTITDTTKCVEKGVGGVFDIWATDDNYFDRWGFSTHGWFTNLLPGTVMIVCVAGTNDPTYISYDYGRGEVWATMQTVEWGWDASLCAVGDRGELLRNEIRCANRYRMVPSSTQWGLILLILAVAAFLGYVLVRTRRAIVSSR